jgi:heat shock protein beta
MPSYVSLSRYVRFFFFFFFCTWYRESTADSSFTVTKDPRGNTLGRGTEITMFLKEDAHEFAKQERLDELIKRYSEFITFPIYLYEKTTETVETGGDDEDGEEDDSEDSSEDSSSDGLEVKEEAEEKKTESVSTRVRTLCIVCTVDSLLVNSQYHSSVACHNIQQHQDSAVYCLDITFGHHAISTNHSLIRPRLAKLHN